MGITGCYRQKEVWIPRFCVDYRNLNSVMHADRCPLLRVEEILVDMRGSSVFITIDLFQGYWQIKIDETCKKKAAFICRYGTFQIEVMPFGLMNSQATFQRMPDRILLNVAHVLCYVDDVVVFSKDTEEHASHLENVFATLKNNGLRSKIKKFCFMQPSVELSGHIVNKNGVHVDEHKVEKVRDAVPPTTRKEIRSFLRLASYYRRFIPKFAMKAKPLNEKTADKVKFVWPGVVLAAFEELSVNFPSAPVFAYPDYEKPFVIRTDASRKATGAFLLQPDENGRDHPMHYAYRALPSAESKYSAFEREALGVVFALKNMSSLLEIEQVQTYTDHQALKYVLDVKMFTVGSRVGSPFSQNMTSRFVIGETR